MFKKIVDTPKKLIITILVTLASLYLAVWAVFTIIIPLSQGDGVAGFSGVQHRLAVDLTDFVRSADSPSPAPSFTSQVHVDSIYLTTDSEVAQECPNKAWVTKDPTKVGAYTITLSEKALGSWQTTHYHIVGCSTNNGILYKYFGHVQ